MVWVGFSYHFYEFCQRVTVVVYGDLKPSNNTLHHYSLEQCQSSHCKSLYELHQGKVHCYTALTSLSPDRVPIEHVGDEIGRRMQIVGLPQNQKIFLDRSIREKIQLSQSWPCSGNLFTLCDVITVPVFPPMEVTHSTDSDAAS